jgi:hypothetical protein
VYKGIDRIQLTEDTNVFAGPLDHGNEPSTSRKTEDFCGKLNEEFYSMNPVIQFYPIKV